MVAPAARAEPPAPFPGAVCSWLGGNVDLVVPWLSQERLQDVRVSQDQMLVPLLGRPVPEQHFVAEVALLSHVLVLEMLLHRRRLVGWIYGVAVGIRTPLAARQDQVAHVVMIPLQAADLGRCQD